MLGSNLCELCGRHCSSDEKQTCLAAPVLNLGSGKLLRKDCINFDMQEFSCGDISTDIIGNIKNITNIFQPKTFAAIHCIHVLEHFYLTDALSLIENCRAILRTDGKLIMVGPDVVKITKLYANDPSKLVQQLYGNEVHRKQWGNEWMHKWGWTGFSVADAMEKQNFRITYKGDGLVHNAPTRDYRVDGVKRR